MFKGNMSKMLKQAQEMQKRMETVQNELRDIVLDADSGGGMVNVKINCNLELQELNIQDEVFNEDREMIEDLVISAVNKGISMAQAKSKEKMDSVTGGMLSGLNISGM